MLLSAVIGLSPRVPASAPATLGRAAHAWLLERIGQADAGLARQLHEEGETRPFTVSNVWGKGPVQADKAALHPEQACWLRVTALTAEVSQAVRQTLPAPGEQVTLGEIVFAVREVATEAEQHPWAGQATYAGLVQHYTLASGPRPRGVVLRFASPTLFRSGGHDVPLPLPALVFGSYLRKWNTFSPITLPEEARRYAEECTALGRFKLRSHFVSFEAGDKGAHVGFTGEARFRFLVGDAYWTRVLQLLAGYAFWAGSGYRTTVGLGQTQAVRE